jgi:EmrB/QacA subfamily drug resistance transporter
MAERGHAVTKGDGTAPRATSPWPALWALVVGFFMILVDATIVSVATPAIMADLGADVASVVWVTSAYLLAFAIPLLVTGRLGDRYGPKQVYTTGLVIFTLASLWCGLTTNVEQLIVARIVQGLGASLMNPQTMAVITRTFPADQRGRAMSLWGAVAGVATLVGPILGGVLVDGLGWEWIFFVNVPVGVIALVLAVRLVPDLPTHVHRFDLLGVLLSAVGMFLLVFGIQEGQTFEWGTIIGPISVWSLIIAGLVVLAGFVFWQARNRGEPLLSLALFRDRNFSLAIVAITTVGFSITSMGFPLMLYAQGVRGLTPTQAALLLAPMAVVSGALAPLVGRLTDRHHPRYVAGFGLVCFPAALAWLAAVLVPGAPIWQLLLPIALLGVGSACAVLGSAGVAAIMESRLAALLPGISGDAEAAQLPPALHGAFATAMAQSLLLPAAVLLIGLAAALCFTRPTHLRSDAAPAAAAGN